MEEQGDLGSGVGDRFPGFHPCYPKGDKSVDTIPFREPEEHVLHSAVTVSGRVTLTHSPSVPQVGSLSRIRVCPSPISW